MGNLFDDLRFAFRQFGRSSGLAFFVVATLAVGIGANTTIFSAVNAFLLRPLPYAESEQLHALSGAYRNRGDNWSVALPNALDWGRRSRSFTDVAYYQGTSLTVAGSQSPERLDATRASSNLFALLGVQPQLGRGFTAEENEPGGERVVILSHALWQSRFGGAPDVIGRAITLSGNPHTVIGVMPAGFAFPYPNVRLYVPVRANETTWNRASGGLSVLARLKPGVTAEAAQNDMDRVSAELAREYKRTNEELTAAVKPLRTRLLGGEEVTIVLYTLLGAVGFVLLIACVNVANLLLARATGREREIAVRAAIGANRGRVMRQLLTESLVLAVTGGLAGLALSVFGARLLMTAIPEDSPWPRDLAIDGRVMLFTMAITLFTGVLFGLAPALNAARADLSTLIGGRSGAHTKRRTRVRGTLVVAQVALAVVLLVAAGLMIRSLTGLLSKDPGFNAANVMTMRVALDGTYSTPEQTAVFQNRALEKLRALPGVEQAGAADWLPLAGTNNFNDFRFPDRPSDKWENAGSVMISPGYLGAMNIRVLRGRDFSDGDVRSSPGVALVNRAFADKYFPGRDPIGERIEFSFEGKYTRTIVGVVGNVMHGGLDEEQRTEIYVPFAQLPWAFTSMAFVLRTRANPTTLLQPAQAAIWSIDPNQAVFDTHTMQRIVNTSSAVFIARMVTGALGVFGMIALLLAAIGLYGVISYGVAQRTYEIGVRGALGATSMDVMKLILGQGLGLVAIGLAAGLFGAFAITRVLAGLLHGVGARDPGTFGLAAVTLFGVAVLASLIPARRAARIDPAITLRAE